MAAPISFVGKDQTCRCDTGHEKVARLEIEGRRQIFSCTRFLTQGLPVHSHWQAQFAKTGTRGDRTA